MKDRNKISYVLTFLIALSLGVFGTYLFMDTYHKETVVEKTEKVVSVT